MRHRALNIFCSCFCFVEGLSIFLFSVVDWNPGQCYLPDYGGVRRFRSTISVNRHPAAVRTPTIGADVRNVFSHHSTALVHSACLLQFILSPPTGWLFRISFKGTPSTEPATAHSDHAT